MSSLQQRQTRQQRFKIVQQLNKARLVHAIRRNDTIGCGDTETIQDALDLGVDVNEELSNGFAPLTYASKKGNTNAARVLLQAGADVNRLDPDGYTALHIAAVRDDIRMGGLLLSQPSIIVDKRTTTHALATALEFSVFFDSFQMVRELVACGASINSTNNGSLPLACVAQSIPMLACLRENGVNICEVSDDGRANTPLHFAVLNDNLPFVQYLAAYTPVDKRNGKGHTALHLAIAKGNFEISRWLVEHGGANPRLEVNNDAGAALHLACADCQTNLVVWLLDNKILNPHEASPLGVLPLHYACVRKEGKEESAILLVAGLLTRMDDDTDPQFIAALAIAAEWSVRICRLLIEKCTRWWNMVACELGIYALYHAAEKGTPETVSYLVSVMKDRNWDLDFAPFRNGSTVLHAAVASKNPDKVSILLQGGCSVHAINESGQAALHVYIMNKVNNLQILKLLLHKGADPTKVDNEGRVPFCNPAMNAAEVNLMAHSAAALGFFSWGVPPPAVPSRSGRNGATVPIAAGMVDGRLRPSRRREESLSTGRGRTRLPRRAKDVAKKRLHCYR